MKKIILSIATTAALAVGAPALAQYESGYDAGANIGVRIGNLQTRIQTGVQQGTISREEAYPLRQQLRDLTRIERQYSVNGLTGQERGDLQRRLQNLRQQIRYAEGGRGQDGYGQYDRDDRYGQSARVDRDRDGYDDRDYDRDGRWDDDQDGYGQSGYDNRDYGRNGRYEDGYQDEGYQQPAQRGGVGGLIDGLLGGGGLRVGQRAPGNLYGVPSQYRYQYRDGNDAYYRSDGRNIYQIDTRTQTVVRVYSMNR